MTEVAGAAARPLAAARGVLRFELRDPLRRLEEALGEEDGGAAGARRGAARGARTESSVGELATLPDGPAALAATPRGRRWSSGPRYAGAEA